MVEGRETAMRAGSVGLREHRLRLLATALALSVPWQIRPCAFLYPESQDFDVGRQLNTCSNINFMSHENKERNSRNTTRNGFIR